MKQTTIILSLIFSLFLIGCTNEDSDNQPDTRDILEKLRELEGVTVNEIQDESQKYKRLFQIDIVQPVDHNNPSGETFKQRIYLYHNDENFPVIMNTAGYSTGAYVFPDLPDMFDNNYMTITHRYFEGAEPESMDWKYLNITQSAQDHHKITTKFKQIYTKGWLNTGGSKGGMTALFHRYFYPEDVDATVAYVAPIMTTLPDTRFDDYLKNRATDAEGVSKINKFQRTVLNRIDSMTQILENYGNSRNLKFSIGYVEAIELGIMEYWFSFFQFGTADINSIPDENTSDVDLFNHFNSISRLIYYSDSRVKRYLPFYYQAFTELGYYYLIDEHLKDLLQTVDATGQKLLAPQDIEMVYDSTLMKKIHTWLQAEAQKVIYIYGSQDPYTAAGVNPVPSNCLYYVADGKDHSAKIADLKEEEQKVIKEKLGEWLNIKISRKPKTTRRSEEKIHPDFRRGHPFYK